MNTAGFRYTPTVTKEDFVGKDPVRYPKVQLKYEGAFILNYEKTLKVIQTEITKLIK